MNLKDELSRWRDVSRKLDQIHEAEKADRLVNSCPFCGKSCVRVETMDTTSGKDRNMRIGFFTCPSCNESWSDLIQ